MATIPHPGRRAVLALLATPLATRAEGAGAVRMAVPAMAEVIDPAAVPRPVYDAGLWCEGPVWAPALGGLLFSDVKRNRIARLVPAGRAETFRAPSNNANGNTLDRENRLLTCEHRTRRIVRQEEDGSLTTIAERFEGKRLNAPNDLATGPDGAVWFTDPTFGLTQPAEGLMEPPELPGRYVFRLDPDGTLAIAADGFDQPNGIVFSPDGTRLYVGDTGAATNDEGPREIRVFDLDGTRLRNERLFARLDAGVPDGLTVDEAGRLYAATAEGIRVWTPDGASLGVIATPGTASNLTFGGEDGRTLFITSGTTVLAVPTRVRGAHRGG